MSYNRCPRCRTPMDQLHHDDLHPATKRCPGCLRFFILGQEVKTSRAAALALFEEREQDPRACFYLICATCFCYHPEVHSGTADWIRRHQPGYEEGAEACKGDGWGFRRYYREAKLDDTLVPLQPGLPPLEALAWEGRS